MSVAYPEPVGYQPFYNVREGGPKEKRLFRVALMGEYNKIKPTFWIKIEQKEGVPVEDLLDASVLLETFETYGPILKTYRPLNKDTEVPRLFAFVGFAEEHVPAEVLKEWGGDDKTINGAPVTVSLCQKWFVDLHPSPDSSFLDSLVP
jgi:hypothetical protein